jgi:hypothetical protein
MPRLSCWFIKAALAHLAVGVTLGGCILIAKGFPLTFGWAWLLLPAHIQLVASGWLIQLTLGVAYWILPRLNGAGARGRDVWVWASFWMLNISILASTLLLLIRPFVDVTWVTVALLISAIAHVFALAAFAFHIWPRLAPLPPLQPRNQAAPARS